MEPPAGGDIAVGKFFPSIICNPQRPEKVLRGKTIGIGSGDILEDFPQNGGDTAAVQKGFAGQGDLFFFQYVPDAVLAFEHGRDAVWDFVFIPK